MYWPQLGQNLLKDIKTIMIVQKQLYSESTMEIYIPHSFSLRFLWIICHSNKETKCFIYDKSMIPACVHGLPLKL